jgi:hypothetical protein
MIFTDPTTRNSRISTCNACQYKNGVKCIKCGCFILLLTKVKIATCPIQNW